MAALLRLLLALALTVAVEGLLMLVLTHSRRFAYYSLLCNMLTNPPLNLTVLLLAPYISGGAYVFAVAALELAVVAVEGAVLRRLTRWPARRAYGVALLLNAVSFAFGLMIF